MISVSGYRMVAEIHESVNSIAFQAVREADGESVIIKVLKDEYPSPHEIVKYKREYEISQTLRTLSCIAQVLALQRQDNRLAMILEDFGGQSLKKWLQERPFLLEEGLFVASQAAAALAQVHEARVIHKDINPANIVYNREKRLVKIIDFGIATLVPR